MFDFSYLLIFAAAAACVFGVASLFERPRSAVISIRRGGSSSWFATKFGRIFQPSEKERLTNARWLLQAGFESSEAPQTYLATRMLLAITLPLLVLTTVPLAKPDITFQATLIFAVSGAAVGLIVPLMYVRSRRAKRQQAVRNGLPDILDLLLVSTEAGLGLDTAILRVGEETEAIHPVLGKYLLQVSSELRAGRPRADAFHGFGHRCGLQETTTMVNLLVQSDALGTSMATTLRAFADDLRSNRLLRAEEIGQKISVKLSIVLVFCFLPALFIAIFAPVATRFLFH
jgi:tight adherence protein C